MMKIACISLFLLCSKILFCQYHAEQKNGKWGILSEKGEEVLPFEYNEITPVNYSALDFVTGTATIHQNEYFLLKKGEKWGIFNAPKKTFLLEMKYEEVRVDYGLGGNYLILAAKLNNKYALFDPKGVRITEFDYKEIDTGDFNGNTDSIITYVSKNNKDWIMIDRHGKIIK